MSASCLCSSILADPVVDGHRRRLRADAASRPRPPRRCSAAELPVIGKGPNGEDGVPLSALTLTDEEDAKIKAGNFKAAIAMHYLAADWPQLQVNGIKTTLAKYGVEVIAATDGELKAEKQTADIESLMELKPNVILIIAVDNDGAGAGDQEDPAERASSWS